MRLRTTPQARKFTLRELGRVGTRREITVEPGVDSWASEQPLVCGYRQLRCILRELTRRRLECAWPVTRSWRACILAPIAITSGALSQLMRPGRSAGSSTRRKSPRGRHHRCTSIVSNATVQLSLKPLSMLLRYWLEYSPLRRVHVAAARAYPKYSPQETMSLTEREAPVSRWRKYLHRERSGTKRSRLPRYSICSDADECNGH
ncbi:hypothetical protein OH77DRAFT_110522 [Trametes cingulata]|nr:hypothetical protein OH77DRAFT_110522 [Trametes cingulata]